MALWSSRSPLSPPACISMALWSSRSPLSPPTRVSMAVWSSRNPEVPPQSSDARLYGTLVLQEPGSSPSVLRRDSLWQFGPPGTRKCPLSPPTRLSMAVWSSRNPEVPPQSSDATLYGSLVLQEPGSSPSVLRRASLWHFGPPGTRKCPLSPPTRLSMALWSSRSPEVLIGLLEITCFQHSSTKISEDCKNKATPAELSSLQQQVDRTQTKGVRKSPEMQRDKMCTKESWRRQAEPHKKVPCEPSLEVDEH
ncbi:uncharacterized protein LOC128900097 [Rissa tridactyla]|uniref:uncharacterized protein LOC128900097 n=1 Tax=Rissa tridactyla TaxID=75485 RepID=UPI0023BA9B06|nr:uncharacterized protein LOC128900097 [Rissa tridactyla]